MSPPVASARLRAPRWLAASALLIGGALVVGASFLPFGVATTPAMAGDVASTVTDIPAHDLIVWLVVFRHFPYSLTISTLLWGFFLWGAPAILALLGAALLWAPRWAPTWRAVLAGVILLVIGAGYTALACWGYLHPFFGSQGATRTLAYGPIVAALGYLSCLTGVIALPFIPRLSR